MITISARPGTLISLTAESTPVDLGTVERVRQGNRPHLIVQGVSVIEQPPHTFTRGVAAIEQRPHTFTRGVTTMEQQPHTITRGVTTIADPVAVR